MTSEHGFGDPEAEAKFVNGIARACWPGWAGLAFLWDIYIIVAVYAMYGHKPHPVLLGQITVLASSAWCIAHIWLKPATAMPVVNAILSRLYVIAVGAANVVRFLIALRAARRAVAHEESPMAQAKRGEVVRMFGLGGAAEQEPPSPPPPAAPPRERFDWAAFVNKNARVLAVLGVIVAIVIGVQVIGGRFFKSADQERAEANAQASHIEVTNAAAAIERGEKTQRIERHVERSVAQSQEDIANAVAGLPPHVTEDHFAQLDAAYRAGYSSVWNAADADDADPHSSGSERVRPAGADAA